MKNILLNYDREQLFEELLSSGIFEEYESKLSEDDYNDLLNDVVYFCSTIEVKNIKE
jgi:hypothetical protein